MSDFTQRYERAEVLGEGSTARVFKGLDLFTGEDVAIKVANSNLGLHQRFVQRWQREIALLVELQHPRIVPLIDASSKGDSHLYMVLSYAAGGALDQRLSTGCLVRHALKWLYQTLEALSYLHSFHIIHQDIKPENILLTAAGDVWLADFSVARTRAELLLNRKEITGTPEWFAPEQRMKKSAEIGPWTDIFAWGRILDIVISAIGYRSVEFDDIISGCLEIDPQQRFRSAPEILMLFEQATDALPPNILRKRLRLNNRPRKVFILQNGFSFPEDSIPKWKKGISRKEHGLQPNFREVPNSLFVLSKQIDWNIPPDLFEALWGRTQRVVTRKKTEVLFLVGERGQGKRHLLRKFSRLLYERGIMESLILSYHEEEAVDDGYRGIIRQILSPQGDNRDSFVQRVKRWLARKKQSFPREMEQEAIALAKWCGFVEPEEANVESGLGLVFLFQYLQSLSWRGGVALMLENPEYCSASGDGLDICETLLSGVLGDRPILVVCTISKENLRENPRLSERIEALCRMGAQKIEHSNLRNRALLGHLSRFCLIPEKLHRDVLHLCEGKITLANHLLRSLAARGHCKWVPKKGMFSIKETVTLPKQMTLFIDIHLSESFERMNNPEAAKEILAVMISTYGRTDIRIANEINTEGVTELIEAGLIEQRDRSLKFAFPQLRSILPAWLEGSTDFPSIHKKIAETWSNVPDQKGLSFTFNVGRALLLSGDPSKSMPSLLMAVREAKRLRLWKLMAYIAHLVERASKETNSVVGRVEGQLNQLEAYLGLRDIAKANEVLATLKQYSLLDKQMQARIAFWEAELCWQQKEWTIASQLLNTSQRLFSDCMDVRGQSLAYKRQGYLLLMHNRLQRAADRFAQALRLSNEQSLDWAETQARLVEIRLRLRWMHGLADDVKRLLRTAQKNADIHHMAYATYAAGLLLLNQKESKAALYRLQTAQALAASCGDAVLLSESLEHQGFVHFLLEEWSRAAEVQKRLVHFYDVRQEHDKRFVAQIRAACALQFAGETGEAPAENELHNASSGVWYWWWIFQILRQPGQASEAWRAAQPFAPETSWDFALYKVLLSLSARPKLEPIRVKILSVVRERFPQRL